jgi:hypothetical protein
MGFPSSDPSGPARPTPGYAALQRDYVPPPPEPDVRRQPIVRHLVLFAATLLATTVTGIDHYVGFTGAAAAPTGWALYQHGLWYSAAVLGIQIYLHHLAIKLQCVDSKLGSRNRFNTYGANRISITTGR